MKEYIYREKYIWKDLHMQKIFIWRNGNSVLCLVPYLASHLLLSCISDHSYITHTGWLELYFILLRKSQFIVINPIYLLAYQLYSLLVWFPTTPLKYVSLNFLAVHSSIKMWYSNLKYKLRYTSLLTSKFPGEKTSTFVSSLMDWVCYER